MLVFGGISQKRQIALFNSPKLQKAFLKNGEKIFAWTFKDWDDVLFCDVTEPRTTTRWAPTSYKWSYNHYI